MIFKSKKPMTFERLMSRSFGKESSSFWPLSPSPRGLTLDDVQKYLDEGGDANARTANQQTLLHIAADNGETDIVRLLLTYGADINAKGYYGYTALHLAVDSDIDAPIQSGRAVTELPVARLLIESGADESIRAENGETPREIAVAYGNKLVALYDAIPRTQSTHS